MKGRMSDASLWAGEAAWGGEGSWIPACQKLLPPLRLRIMRCMVRAVDEWGHAASVLRRWAEGARAQADCPPCCAGRSCRDGGGEEDGRGRRRRGHLRRPRDGPVGQCRRVVSAFGERLPCAVRRALARLVRRPAARPDLYRAGGCCGPLAARGPPLRSAACRGYRPHSAWYSTYWTMALPGTSS